MAGEWAIEWTLKRNCSLAPRQLLGCFTVLCAFSLAVAAGFWLVGARWVMPFTSLELVVVAGALVAYGRHAADRERIALDRDRLTVERACGGRVERVEFRPSWVRVEAPAGDALVELSGQGRRIAVGCHVRPAHRQLLAAELRMALRRAGGPGGRGGTDGIGN